MIVVSEDPNLFASVRATLSSDGRFIDTDEGVHCDGSVAPHTNIYPVEMSAAEWDGWDTGDGQLPDPRSMSALIFESWSATWIAEIGKLLAHGVETPIWFVDSADTVWPAGLVDPDRIALT